MYLSSAMSLPVASPNTSRRKVVPEFSGKHSSASAEQTSPPTPPPDSQPAAAPRNRLSIVSQRIFASWPVQSLLAYLTLWSTGLLPSVPVRPIPLALQPDSRIGKPSNPGSGHDWPKSFDVMASSSQDQTSFSGPADMKALELVKQKNQNWEDVYTSNYLRLLLSKLENTSIKGLPQAHEQSEQHMRELDEKRPDLELRYQQPVSTFKLPGGGGCSECWQKSDRKVKRYALLCGSMHQDIAEMKKMLKKVYGLSDKQIIKKDSPYVQEVEEGIRQLGLQVDRALEKGEQTEVLLFIGGHGSAVYNGTTTDILFDQVNDAEESLIDELYKGKRHKYWDAKIDSLRLPGVESALTPADQEHYQYFKERYQKAKDEILRTLDENTLEGQKNGRVQLQLNSFFKPLHELHEEDVKHWVKTYIPAQANGLVIVASCHSGSWTG